MEPKYEYNKNIILSHECVRVGAHTHTHTHTDKLQRIQRFFFMFSLRVGFVYMGLLHHLRALTERDGLCGKRMDVW